MAINPYVNKVEINGVTKLDLTADTVEPQLLLKDITAHDMSGAPITGNLVVPVNQNNKAYSILGNGTFEITPDNGYDGMEKATITANVSATPDYYIVVTTDEGATVTATKGSTTVTGVSTGTCTLTVHETGTWNITVTKGSQTKTGAVVVTDEFETEIRLGITLAITAEGSTDTNEKQYNSYVQIGSIIYTAIGNIDVDVGATISIYGKTGYYKMGTARYSRVGVKQNGTTVGDTTGTLDADRITFKKLYDFTATRNCNIALLAESATSASGTFYVEITDT